MKRTIQVDWDGAGDFEVLELENIVKSIISFTRLGEEFPDGFLKERLDRIKTEIEVFREIWLEDGQK